jgi:spermidine synthase
LSSLPAVLTSLSKPAHPSHPPAGPLLFLLYFFSGALGLVYEVLWMRRLTTLFGGTSLAVTATLSGFFLGLALGSLALGERARRWRRPLVAFGVLEIAVGLGALLFNPILGLYRDVYPVIRLRLADTPAAFALVKLVLAWAAVGIPTFCMGATLPALGEAVAPSGKRLGVPIGGLYAINLLGAAVGTLAVPFALLPRLGLDATYGWAVAGSLTVGLIACTYRARPASGAVRVPKDALGAPSVASVPSVPSFVLVLSAVSGLSTLALQTLWARMFSLVHENSVHAFAVVLFVFMIGLTGGAALARREIARDRPPRALLGAAWCVAGLLVAASPRFFEALTGGLAYVSAETWDGALGRLLAVAAATMLPATLALGTALPLVMEMAGASSHDTAGPVIGRLLAANTLGAMAGPVVATFVMGPLLGLWPSLVILGAALVFAGALTGLPRVHAAVAVGILAGVMVLGATDLPPVRVRASEGERLVSVREGAHGTTAVMATAHDRWITVNSSYVLGGTAVAEEERWQAHLPLLLHPSPRRVAFLGMGTGITAGAALMHPVGSVVALEIVPEVVEAARQDFADWNARLVDDPRVEIVVDDGRNYLAFTPGAFDVIVGDLLVPWRPAEAPLYTREHFASVRAALAPDGLFCQWLPLYQLSPDQLAIIARTFLDVFPDATLWRGNFDPAAATIAVVGHRVPRALDVAGIDDRLRRLAVSSERNAFLQHPAGMWLFLVGPLRPTLPWIYGARPNLDAEPWVELLSPVAHAGRDRGLPAQVIDLLQQVATEPLDGTPLRGLDDRHRAWTTTGRELSRASLVRGEEGQRHVLEILRTLPPDLQRSLEVGP